MKLPKNPLTEAELRDARSSFLAGCEKVGSILVHKNCGGAIRRGFINCFWAESSGALNSGEDGFGIGPVGVPYCEKCDPPDGFNYTYAIRVGIFKEPAQATI